MATTPTDTPSENTKPGSASNPTGSEAPDAEPTAAPTSEIHLHPRYAASLLQETEDLATAYLEMKSVALDLIDQQIHHLSRGTHDLPRALSTLVIATLAETRINLLAIDPTAPESGKSLTEIVTKLRTLVIKPEG